MWDYVTGVLLMNALKQQTGTRRRMIAKVGFFGAPRIKENTNAITPVLLIAFATTPNAATESTTSLANPAKASSVAKKQQMNVTRFEKHLKSFS